MAPKKERYFSSNIIFSLKNIILAAARVNFFFVIRWAGNKPIISFSLTNWVTNKCPHVHPLPLAESKDATFQAHLRCSRKLSAPVRKKGNSRRSVMPAGKSMAISGRLRSNSSRWFTRWSWLMRQCYWCHNLKCRCLCERVSVATFGFIKSCVSWTLRSFRKWVIFRDMPWQANWRFMNDRFHIRIQIRIQ